MDWLGNAGHGVRLPDHYLSRTQWRAVLATAGLRVEGWEERLGLYPPAVDWLFGRRLHFAAKLVPGARSWVPSRRMRSSALLPGEQQHLA